MKTLEQLYALIGYHSFMKFLANRLGTVVIKGILAVDIYMCKYVR